MGREKYCFVKAVLIPSSSGQGFKGARIHHECPRQGVLIPSSSGQGFKESSVGLSLVSANSLNPFFIRARFQRHGDLRPSPDHARLNPFFIRARFQRFISSRAAAQAAVLIPSSSGQGFKVWGDLYIERVEIVLIPSSSGQGFKGARAWSMPPKSPSLNPFFIRARFQRPALVTWDSVWGS